MADFNFVTSRLATGGALSGPADVGQLVAVGITAVIDCRAEYDDAPLFAAGCMRYVWNPTADDGSAKPSMWFQVSLDFALPLFAQPHMKVYVHCAAGVNRGPSTAYVILRALGLSAADAEATIRKARPQVGLAYKNDADAAVLKLGYV